MPVNTSSGVKAGSSLSAHNYAFMQRYIHDESGIVIDADKQYLLEARLLPIARDQNIPSLDAMAVMLETQASVQLGRLVVEAMTTNETLFFRDPLMFDSLRDHVLPAMFERLRRAEGGRKLRIWSAASSTGQEAYSVAMTLLAIGKTKADVEILGTDLSRPVLERAREARYTRFDVNRGLSAAHLARFFTPEGADWQLNDEVREMARFEHLDLRRNFRFLGTFDIILCRNVLIYFDNETKRQIAATLRDLLTPEGVLVMGCAETMINIHNGFERRLVGSATFYHR